MDRRMWKLGVDKITASYLKLQGKKQYRENVFGFNLLFLNFCGLLPLLGVPRVWPLFMIAFVPAMIINLWGILYLVDPYRFELSFYLYFGIYGFVNTFVFSITLVKILYAHLHVSSVWPILLTLLLVNSLPFVMNWWNYKMLYRGTYAKLQHKKDWKIPLWPFLIIIAGIGLLRFVALNGSEAAGMFALFICLAFLTILTSFISTNVHKYFFLKKHMETILKLHPLFGQPKHIQCAREIELKRRKKQKKNGFALFK